MNIAFCYSTKDRTEFTEKTLPPVLAEADKFDLFLVDGSSTEAGREYIERKSKLPGVKGAYANITGGADFAILFSLTTMLEKGYDYVGLIENDVLLEPGWFDRIFKLFDVHEGVGSVSARCFSDRILSRYNGYAIMANIGAGMVLFKRQAAYAVLQHYRTGSFHEYRYLTEFYTRVPCPVPHEIKDLNQNFTMSADWFFESSMMCEGYASLACAPSMARCIDQDEDMLQTEPTLNTNPVMVVADTETDPFLLGHYDPDTRQWMAHPHTVLDRFKGSWKAVWRKHSGPFAFTTMATGCTIELDVIGSGMALMLEANQGPVEIEIFIKNSKGDFNGVGKMTERFQRFDINFGGFGCYYVKITFKNAGCTLTSLLFDSPQTWFKPGYPLSYRSLEPFLLTEYDHNPV